MKIHNFVDAYFSIFGNERINRHIIRTYETKEMRVFDAYARSELKIYSIACSMYAGLFAVYGHKVLQIQELSGPDQNKVHVRGSQQTSYYRRLSLAWKDAPGRPAKDFRRFFVIFNVCSALNLINAAYYGSIAVMGSDLNHSADHNAEPKRYSRLNSD